MNIAHRCSSSKIHRIHCSSPESYHNPLEGQKQGVDMINSMLPYDLSQLLTDELRPSGKFLSRKQNTLTIIHINRPFHSERLIATFIREGTCRCWGPVDDTSCVGSCKNTATVSYSQWMPRGEGLERNVRTWAHLRSNIAKI